MSWSPKAPTPAARRHPGHHGFRPDRGRPGRTHPGARRRWDRQRPRSHGRPRARGVRGAVGHPLPGHPGSPGHLGSEQGTARGAWRGHRAQPGPRHRPRRTLPSRYTARTLTTECLDRWREHDLRADTTAQDEFQAAVARDDPDANVVWGQRRPRPGHRPDQGSLFGASAPTADIPAQLELYRRGLLRLDELVTRSYRPRSDHRRLRRHARRPHRARGRRLRLIGRPDPTVAAPGPQQPSLSRQPATRPPGSYPDRTHTGKRRRAYDQRSTTLSTSSLLGARKPRASVWRDRGELVKHAQRAVASYSAHGRSAVSEPIRPRSVPHRTHRHATAGERHSGYRDRAQHARKANERRRLQDNLQN